MILQNKYALGTMFQFYEVEMFSEWVDSIENMLKDVENPKNIIVDIHLQYREYFEKMEKDLSHHADSTYQYCSEKFNDEISRLKKMGVKVWQSGRFMRVKLLDFAEGEEPMSIARYRRIFTNQYANQVDYIMWGEADSFFPAETFEVLERISQYADEQKIYKHAISFAYRKMWDEGWKPLEHPKFTNVHYQHNDEWIMGNEASEKCYMSIERMNEINAESDELDVVIFQKPKFDGSCITFSSELVRAGVVLPPALLMSGEDTAFAWAIEKILGNNYVQFHVKNKLRVHNRRHPKKRLYIAGEDNPTGLCGENNKGAWWKLLEAMSKQNLANLDNPNAKFFTWKNFSDELRRRGLLDE